MQLEGMYSGSAVLYEGAAIPGGRAQVHQECNEVYLSQTTTPRHWRGFAGRGAWLVAVPVLASREVGV